MIDCYPEKKEPRIIKLRVDKINSLLAQHPERRND